MQDDSQRFRPTFSEALLTSILDAALDAVITIDAEGTVLTWSAQAERMFGWAAPEAVGRSLATTIIPPRYREQHQQGLARMRTGGQSTILNRRIDLTALHRDGHEIPVELTVTRVPLRDGWLFSAFVRDLTEQKQAEDALRRANDRLSTVIDAAPLAIFAMDAAGFVQTWNSAAERLYGWSAQEAIGRFLPSVSEDTLMEFMGLRRRVLAGERITGVELVHRKKDGGWVNVNLFAAPLHDAEGTVTGILGVVEDVTAVKRLERQFFQAQKMEAVGRLAGGVAHDFNNLLTVIIGGCDLLLMDELPDLKREDLQEIRKAADRATSLTRQLLAFSRQQLLAPQILDLNVVAARVETLLQRLLGRDIELRRIAAPELGAVEADPGQFEQVIMNLAVNALDAMPNGGTLTIETANVELDAAFAEAHPPIEPGFYVMLAVRDTGTGMNEHTRAHLFEPFFTTKARGKGTGLGLAAVYGIVKQSGGYIDASNEPDGGAAFRLYLPWVGGAPNAAPLLPAMPGSLSGTETILLVADDVQVRAFAREALTRYGYSVLDAADVDSAMALEESSAGPIHLLITDVVLPRRSGGELASALGARRPELRVLFMSGYTDDRVAVEREAGDNFLPKPFGPELLAGKVRETLDNPR